MTMRAAVLIVVVVASACGGDDPLMATFTSRVVQLDSCRKVGDGDEGCARQEIIAERRFTIIETDPGIYWLHGLPRDGVPDRAILGSDDNVGGFLFVDERRSVNSQTLCELTTRTELSLTIDPDAIDLVGTNECVALLGRSTDIVSSSAACDQNVPAQAVVQTVRRRFERPAPGGLCASGQ